MNDYDKFRPLLEANKAILVIGEVSTGEDKPKIFPQEIMPLADAPKKYTKQVHLRLHTAHLQPEDLDRSAANSSPRMRANARCSCVSCGPEGGTVFVDTHERFGVTPSLELEHAANKLVRRENLLRQGGHEPAGKSAPQLGKEKRLRRWRGIKDSLLPPACCKFFGRD